MSRITPPSPCSNVPLDCSICGAWLIDENLLGNPFASSHYNGTDVCDDCIVEHCLNTNCLGCHWGEYPNCQYLRMKQLYMEEE